MANWVRMKDGWINLDHVKLVESYKTNDGYNIVAHVGDGWRIIRCESEPWQAELWMEQHLGPLERTNLPEVAEVLEGLIREVKTNLEEVGGCDHSVGICACETISLLDRAERVLQRLKEAVK